MKLGAWGESIAADHLAAQGYQILTRNWHAREGEIDLVARQGDELVFIEVKTRLSSKFGSPEAAVGPRKQSRLRKAAWRYLQATEQTQVDWRIDVIAIERARDGSISRLEHYPHAVGAPEDANQL